VLFFKMIIAFQKTKFFKIFFMFNIMPSKIRYTLLFFIFSIIGPNLLFSQLASCESSSYERIIIHTQGKRYDLIMKACDWLSATEYAVERGAKLAEILRADEQEGIFDAIRNSNLDKDYFPLENEGGASFIWLGGSDLVLDGTWQWDGDGNGIGDIFYIGEGAVGNNDGVAYLYENWGRSSDGELLEPDNRNNAQHTLGMGLSDWNQGRAGEWNDLEDALDLYFLIEYPCEDVLITLDTSICEGDSILFGNEYLKKSGEYEFRIASETPCDTLLTLNLRVNTIKFDTIHASFCVNKSYEYADTILTEEGSYDFAFRSSDGCDSLVHLELVSLPINADTITRYICEGDSILFEGSYYFSSGIYSFVYQNMHSCDSTVNLELFAGDFSITDVRVSMCAGESYIFGDSTLTESGTYRDTVRVSLSCDSITVLQLDVIDEIITEITDYICSGESYIFGADTLQEAGTYTLHLESAEGCDSTVVLELVMAFPSMTNIFDEFCEGSDYLFDGTFINIPGRFEFTYENRFGCDSIIVLNLSRIPRIIDSIELVACGVDEIFFGDQTITEDGQYSYAFPSSLGCDSLVVMDVVFIAGYFDTLEHIICSNEFVVIGNDTLNETGRYEYTFSISENCDSVVIIDLVVNPAFQEIQTETICAGGGFMFRDSIYREEGMHVVTFETSSGCDSLYILELRHNPSYNDTIEISECGPDFYVFNEDTLRINGLYRYDFETSEGCDSIIHISLNLFNNYITRLEAEICEGESYQFGLATLTESGSYSSIFILSPVCDSTVILNLTLHPTYNDTIHVSKCSGDFVVFGVDTLYDSGTYVQELQSSRGCDSTSVLIIDSNPEFYDEITVFVCGGEMIYMFNEMMFTEDGIYTFEFETQDGCDSVIVLDLRFFPENLTQIQERICEGDTLFIHNQELTQPGLHTVVFENEEACDSIVEVTLEVVPTIFQDLSASFCEGSSYLFGNENYTEPGNYTIEMISQFTGCKMIVNLSLEMNTGSSDTSFAEICAGELIVFEGQEIYEPGIYTIKYLNVSGCDSLKVLNLDVNRVDLTVASDTICVGETYFAGDYEINSPGLHVLEFVNINGCDSIVRLNLLNYPEVNTHVEIEENILVATGEGITFVWLDCDKGFETISEAGPVFEAEITGNYAVEVFDGVCIDTSDCFMVMVVSTEEMNHSNLSVYPNPTTGQIFVKNNAEIRRIEVLSADGKAIFHKNTGSVHEEKLDLRELLNGVYFLRVYDSHRVETVKLVKQ
jgi:hypothetical protein